MIAICAAEAPGLAIHLSTQASATNYETLEFWKNLGLERVVLAREVSVEELREIRQHTDVEIEALFTEPCVFHTQDVVSCQII